MKTLIAWLNDNGTKVIGVAQGTVATLCGVAGVIPEPHLKYWLAASAVLTFWRGYANSKRSNSHRPDATPAEHAARDHVGTDQVQ